MFNLKIFISFFFFFFFAVKFYVYLNRLVFVMYLSYDIRKEIPPMRSKFFKFTLFEKGDNYFKDRVVSLEDISIHIVDYQLV